MYLLAAKTLILSLLVSAPLALTAPSDNNALAARSVQLQPASIIHDDGSHDFSKRRRTPDALSALAARLQARAPPKPHQPPAGVKPTLPKKGTPAHTATVALVTLKGKKFKTALDNTITNQIPDKGLKVKVVGEPPNGLGYKEAVGAIDKVDASDLSYIKRYGMQIDPVVDFGWKTRTVYSDTEGQPTISLSVSVQQRAAAILHSYGQKFDSLKKTSWTHMVYDTLSSMFGPDLNKLQFIIRDKIGSQTTLDSEGVALNTQDAIDHAFDLMKKPKDGDEPLTINFDSQDPNEVAAIDYLSGQTHVARVLQFLADYREELGGNKKIVRLYLYHEQMELLTSEFNIVIELSV